MQGLVVDDILPLTDVFPTRDLHSIAVGRESPRAAPRVANFAVTELVPKAMNHLHVFENFHLVVCDDPDSFRGDPAFCYFSIEGLFTYVGFCDDFGPMSLGTVYEFCQFLDLQLSQSPARPKAMLALSDSRSLTNAVFLIGAYMTMKFDMKPGEIESKFQDLNAKLVSYRDVCPGEQNFHLYLRDCWAGLAKAKSLRWVDFGADGFDLCEYKHFEDPLNADLHEIVPGKFVAMRGPKDLERGVAWKDVLSRSGRFSHREFSPSHYVEILEQFNVEAVVRLNAPEYNKQAFHDAGIAVADLYFEDCTAPPVDIVAKFMMLAEGIPGAIAVHCKAGLGRTGTLIALYMMKHHGFSAREAMGWLRIVRPGSVIGSQQQFLCDKEPLMRRAHARFQREGPTVLRRAASADAADSYSLATAADTTTDNAAARLETTLALVRRVGELIDHRIEALCAAGPGSRTTPSSPPASPSHHRRPSAGNAAPAIASATVTAGRGMGERKMSAAELAEHVTEAAARRAGRRASVSSSAQAEDGRDA